MDNLGITRHKYVNIIPRTQPWENELLAVFDDAEPSDRLTVTSM